MRIIITGASGNIGSALLCRLTSDDHELVGMARRMPDDPGPYGGVEWVSVDLTQDSCLPTLEHTFAGGDAVVHLAWGFQPSHDPAYLWELGVGGTRRVLTALAGTGVPHLVHMSSIGAYSAKRDDRPVDESWPIGGVRTSRYSVHKAAAEELLDDFQKAGHPTLVTRMRPGIVGQRSAGSALLRYGVPAIVPSFLTRSSRPPSVPVPWASITELRSMRQAGAPAIVVSPATREVVIVLVVTSSPSLVT